MNRNELAVISETDHPHIVSFHELVEDPFGYYIVMELVEGGNVADLLAKDSHRFTEPEVISILQQVLEALNYMHSLNFMHRDLKPQNLLFAESTDANGKKSITVKLTDFGFATKYKPDELQTVALGSPAYMAPEICRNEEYDSKVDVWAAGIMAFELLTGVRPFNG